MGARSLVAGASLIISERSVIKRAPAVLVF